MNRCLLPLIHPSLASIMAILKVWWSVYQFGPDWNLSNNYWKDCTMNFVQTLMIPWGWTWLTLLIIRHFLRQKHRVLICVICDAVSFVIFIYLSDAFGFICSERCSCTESPDLTAVQSKMAWHVLYLIVSFLSCFCVGDSTTRTVSSHALTRCQVRTSLSVLCLPLYRFQPHLHSGG